MKKIMEMKMIMLIIIVPSDLMIQGEIIRERGMGVIIKVKVIKAGMILNNKNRNRKNNRKNRQKNKNKNKLPQK